MLLNNHSSHALRNKRQLVGPALFTLLALVFLVRLAGQDWTAKSASAIEHGRTSQVPVDGLEAALGPQSIATEEGFTLVALVYKRLDKLPAFVQTYANGNIPSLRRIVLIWGDVKTEPPADLVRNITSHKVSVVVERARVDSLNERFRRTDSMKTDCIMSLDDDMTYDARDVEFGYQTWKRFGQGRKHMVGYHARVHDKGKDTYEGEKLRQFSMILTKSAFFHRDWLDAYWSKDEKITSLRKYVDDHMNCEDILMSYIYARRSRNAPIFIKAPKVDAGEGGISGKPGHMAARSECMKAFNKVLGDDTLVSSSMVVKNMASKGGEDSGGWIYN